MSRSGIVMIFVTGQLWANIEVLLLVTAVFEKNVLSSGNWPNYNAPRTDVIININCKPYVIIRVISHGIHSLQVWEFLLFLFF